MLNGRLYRVAFVPFVLALAVAAFSLTARPRPLTSTLAPDAFEGAPALAELKSLAAEFPSRRPGSPGDEALATKIAQTLKGLGAPGHGGFRGDHAQIPGADDRRGTNAEHGDRAACGIERGHADRDPRPPRRARGGWVHPGRTVGDGRADRARARVRGARDAADDRARLDQRRQRRRRRRAELRHGASPPTQASPPTPFDAAIVLGDVAGASRAKAVRGALLGRLRQRA